MTDVIVLANGQHVVCDLAKISEQGWVEECRLEADRFDGPRIRPVAMRAWSPHAVERVDFKVSDRT